MGMSEAKIVIENLSETVSFERDGAIATLCINRPEQRNALNRSVLDGLRAGFAAFEADTNLRVLILTATGDKAFCAGMDLKEAAATQIKVPPRDFLPILGDNIHVSKPVIAAVNGLAYAGGWLLAQMCDLCIAADHAVFGITEAKVGRGMPWAAPLPKMLPQRVVMELLLTAQPITAQRLYELGYINAVVPLADLHSRAKAMALQIAANAPLTVKAARDLVYLSSEMGRSASLRAAHHVFESVYLSEDAQEGPRAFAEKRSPKWQGR
jgi:enoyl-CoA hydratase/carnithine racemase